MLLDRFVPAKIPRKRRFQTLAVAAWSTSILWCPFLFLFLLCVFCAPMFLVADLRCSSFPALWPLFAAHMIWILYLDRSPEHGEQLNYGFPSLSFW